MTQPECRRCGECVGSDHHWMENDDDESMYCCKHCPSLGEECAACDGLLQDDDSEWPGCTVCGGEGIVFTGISEDWDE